MLERNFKSRVQNELKKQGWIFIQLVAESGVPMGFPDTLCMSPTGYSCYVEWKKSRSSKLQPLQIYWNKKLNSMGYESFFVHPESLEAWREYVISKSRELSR